MSRAIPFLLMVAALDMGCSLVSAIDVCDRRPTPAHELNARTEGNQKTSSPNAVAVMPFGGALVAFTSDVSASEGDPRREIRGTLISPDGAPQPTCEEANEYTYAPATGDRDTFDYRTNPFVLPPQNEDGAGVIVYGLDDDASMQVMAHFIGGSACRLGDSLGPVVVSAEEGPPCLPLRDDDLTPSEEARCVSAPQAVHLGPTEDDAFDIAFVWLAFRFGPVTSYTLRARIARVRFGYSEFLPVDDAIDGSPLDLVSGAFIVNHTLVALEDRRFALIWQENGGTGLPDLITKMQIYDERLRPEGDERLLGDQPEGSPASISLDAASDGERLLVVWTARRDDELQSVVARLIDPEGPDLDDGEPFEISYDGGNQLDVTAGALPDDRGFVVAWSAEGSPNHEDQSGSGIRAAALTAKGELRFVNPSCDCTDFQLNDATEGRQERPSLAVLPDGSVLTVWTDYGTNGADLSGSSIRSLVWTLENLLPLE